MPFTPEDEAHFIYTKNADEIERLREAAKATNRHLINRDTDVIGGVWGGNEAEALVVDYDESKPFYDELLDEVKRRSSRPGENGRPVIDKKYVLNAVLETVRDKMRYSLEEESRIFQEYGGGQKDRKVSLAIYIAEGVGVCRHQALAAAAMLELLRREGVIKGSARVNRSVQWPEEGEPGGHAWVRYTNSGNEVYIIDPAQNYIGPLEEASHRKSGWNYLLPTDPKPRRILGSTASHRLINSGDIPR